MVGKITLNQKLIYLKSYYMTRTLRLFSRRFII
ncbi:CRPV-261 [Crowpox virus]|nr:CRPV-261 [Crowpox virus]